jgi:hypothetical protein
MYLQLDATLRAVRPSVLCAPLAIVVNESLLIGIVMGPSESSDLSTTFAWFINLLGIPNHTANPIAGSHFGQKNPALGTEGGRDCPSQITSDRP